MKSFYKKCVAATIFGTIAIAVTANLGMYFSNASTVYAVTPEVIDLTPAKLAALKVDLVDRLSKCESAGHSEDDGLIIFDTNNRASVGQMQWQIASVQYYEKTLHQREVSRKEAVLIALDSTQAKALASEVIFTTKNGTTDWLNCSTKLGLAAEVTIIKKLSK